MARLPETCTLQENADEIEFLQEIHDSLVYDPDDKKAFFALLTDFVGGAITDAQDVMARAEHLLRDDPRLVARFYDLVDPLRRGLEFLERVEKALSPANYDRFVAKLYGVKEEENLNAHQIYRSFKELFGEEHDDLLRDLAGFLPAKYNPTAPPSRAKPERRHWEEHNSRNPERKRSSYAGADAPETESSRAKKPRVVDVVPKPKPACSAHTGAAGSSRARRPRMDEGSLPERKPASCAVAGAPAEGSRPSRAKKSHAAADNKSRCTPVACVAGSSGRVAAAPEPEPEREREPADMASEVRRFRENCVFETGYSLLCATLKRALELKGERLRCDVGALPLEELFPRPECRGHLAKMYNGRWEEMRNLLEHGGSRTTMALDSIVRSLTRKEAEALEESRRRQDPARVAQRLHQLAQERVHLERETTAQRRSP